jgi:hypothetical protein
MIHYRAIGATARKAGRDCGRGSTADERAADISAQIDRLIPVKFTNKE